MFLLIGGDSEVAGGTLRFLRQSGSKVIATTPGPNERILKPYGSIYRSRSQAGNRLRRRRRHASLPLSHGLLPVRAIRQVPPMSMSCKR